MRPQEVVLRVGTTDGHSAARPQLKESNELHGLNGVYMRSRSVRRLRKCLRMQMNPLSTCRHQPRAMLSVQIVSFARISYPNAQDKQNHAETKTRGQSSMILSGYDSVVPGCGFAAL
jgi:hypothetical protein